MFLVAAFHGRSHQGETTIRTVLNKTRKPLRVPLKGGKILHLSPAGRGQVHDDALERPAFQKLVEAGEIEVLGEGDQAASGTDSSTPLHESTQGHPPTKVVLPKGNR